VPTVIGFATSRADTCGTRSEKSVTRHSFFSPSRS